MKDIRVIDISPSESKNCLLHLLWLVFLRTFVFIRLFRVWFILTLIFAFRHFQTNCRHLVEGGEILSLSSAITGTVR